MNRFFLQKVLHRIFTLFLSLAGAFTLIFFIRDALPDGFVKPLGITMLFIAGIDIISILAHDLFVSEKANTFTYIRYAIYLNIILVLIIKFCKPIVSTGLVWVGTNFAVILTYLIKQMFDLYEKFAAHTTGLNGKELSSDLAENNWYVSDYVNYAQKLIFSLFVISLVLAGFALVLHIIKSAVSTPLIISLICFITAYVGLIIVHTVNDHETAFAFLGHSDIFAFRSRIITLCVLLCLVSVGAGTILSSDTAILKPEYFKSLFTFSFEKVPTEFKGYNSGTSEAEEVFEIDEDFYAAKEQTAFAKFMHKVFIALEYISVGAIILGIIWFLISAFFGKKWKDFWSARKLGAFLKDMWKSLKKLIHDLLHMKREKIAYNTVEAASFRDSMKGILSGMRKSKEKRAELDALTKKFMRLVDYAAAKGVSFKPHMAPLEFASLLAASLSEAEVADEAAALPEAQSAEKAPDTSKAEAALSAGRLFEQALYAKELLTKEETTLFTDSIAAVVK